MIGLYKFEALEQKLTDWGYPVISGSGFKSIRIDFRKAYNEGKIEFRSDGIYLIHEGREWKGYMYMPTYRVSYYKDFPRIHLTRCETIDDFISKGMFNTYYIWSNNERNDITDRDTKEIYYDKVLKVCNRCKKIIFGIEDTVDFFQTLDTEPEDIEVDIFGYVKNWQTISKQYRESNGYTCESCGITPQNQLDKRYWHTHHKNGNKLNNRYDNLQCLCLLCHSSNDVIHEENFGTTRMRPDLDSFVKQYRNDLIRVRNPYLAKYDNDNLNK
jgi:hypothetical protein